MFFNAETPEQEADVLPAVWCPVLIQTGLLYRDINGQLSTCKTSDHVVQWTTSVGGQSAPVLLQTWAWNCAFCCSTAIMRCSSVASAFSDALKLSKPSMSSARRLHRSSDHCSSTEVTFSSTGAVWETALITRCPAGGGASCLRCLTR